MGWGQGFKSALKNSMISPSYELRFHENPNMPNTGGFSIYSDQGKTTDLFISREGPTIEGTSIIPVRWSVTLGGFTVPVKGDIRAYKLIRGLYAGIYVSIGAYTERVCFGQLQAVSGVMGVYQLSFKDIISALAVNADATVDTTATIATPRNKWFYRTGIKTTLSADFHAGDTVFSVNELSNFEQENSQNGWCLIDGDATTIHGSQSFGQIYATWTTKSAASGAGTLTTTTDTRTGATIYPGVVANITSNKFYADTPVTPVAMLQGLPWDIFTKLIYSNIGAGGPFDTLPSSYTASGGFGSDLVDYWNAQEMKYFVSSASHVGPPATLASGYSWMIPIESPWDSGLRVFVDAASNAGQWPVWRQDSLTWRACIPLNDNKLQPSLTITESEIISFESFEMFDPNVESSFQGMKITYQLLGETEKKTVYNRFDSALTNPLGPYQNTIPSLPFIEFDNRYLYASSNQTSNDSDRDRMARGDIVRMYPWSKNTLSKIVLKLPLYFSELCAGDIVNCRIPSEFISPYGSNSNLNTWAFKAMVSGITYNFQEAFCTVSLHTYQD